MEDIDKLQHNSSADILLRHAHSLHITHDGPNINNSIVMWSSACGKYVSILKDVKGDQKEATVYVCDTGVADEYLQRFSQRVLLPAPTSHVTRLAISVLVQMLLSAYSSNTGHFEAAGLGFGIKSMRTADRRRVSERLAKQYPEGAPLLSYGDKIFAHSNHAMLETHGLVVWSISCFAQTGWACVLMVDVHSENYKKEIAKTRLSVADIFCGSCSIFYQALAFAKTLGNDAGRFKPPQTIGKDVFDIELNQKGEHEVPKNSVRSVTPPVKLPMKTNLRDSAMTDTSTNTDLSQDFPTTPSPTAARKKKNRQHRRKSSAKPQEAHVHTGEDVLSIQTVDIRSDPNAISGALPEVATPSPSISSYDDESCVSSLEIITPFAHTPTKAVTRAPNPYKIPLSMSEKTPFSSLGQPVFRFDIATLHMKCRLPSCFNMATSVCPTSTICPRCGVFSYIRYCSPLHLHADMRRHFCGSVPRHVVGECGNMAIPVAIDEMTIGKPVGPRRQFIHEQRFNGGRRYTHDIVERHRQAVARSMDPITDYFIFDDLDRIPVSHEVMSQSDIEYQIAQLQKARGTGNVHAYISMPTSDFRKLKFNTLINSCLSLGAAAGTICPSKCAFLYDIIAEELSKHGLWDARMCERVCVQMAFEFCYEVPKYKKILRDDT